jgi:hypothetical protein
MLFYAAMNSYENLLGANQGLIGRATISGRAPVRAAAQEGTKLYRVFGGQAKGLGQSYTTVDPGSLPNYRTAAGLYPGNTGRFVLEGTLGNTEGVIFLNAAPGPGGVGGGLPEVFLPFLPNAEWQIIIQRVSGANPPF